MGVLPGNDFDMFVLLDSFFLDTVSLSGIFLDISVLVALRFPDAGLVSFDFPVSFSVVVLEFFFDPISLVGVFVAFIAGSTFLFGVEGVFFSNLFL